MHIKHGSERLVELWILMNLFFQTTWKKWAFNSLLVSTCVLCYNDMQLKNKTWHHNTKLNECTIEKKRWQWCCSNLSKWGTVHSAMSRNHNVTTRLYVALACEVAITQAHLINVMWHTVYISTRVMWFQ